MQFLKNHRGSSITEFAIVAPVFLLFMFGIMEMGFVLWNQVSLNFAVTQAARYAYITPNVSQQDVITYAKAQIPNNTNVSFTVTVAAKNYVDVAGTMTYSFVFVPLSPITLNASIHQTLQTS